MISCIKLKFFMTCSKHVSVQKYLAFFLFQVNSQWRMLVFCQPWVNVSLEPTSWNLLNDLSISTCTEHNSFSKCSQIPQRKVRLKMYTTYFGWYFRFLIQNTWCVIYSKIYGYWKYQALMRSWEWRFFWIKSGNSFILLYSPTQIKLNHHHHHHHCQIIWLGFPQQNTTYWEVY